MSKKLIYFSFHSLNTYGPWHGLARAKTPFICRRWKTGDIIFLSKVTSFSFVGQSKTYCCAHTFCSYLRCFLIEAGVPPKKGGGIARVCWIRPACTYQTPASCCSPALIYWAPYIPYTKNTLQYFFHCLAIVCSTVYLLQSCSHVISSAISFFICCCSSIQLVDVQLSTY